jgi:hypothetical protein
VRKRAKKQAGSIKTKSMFLKRLKEIHNLDLSVMTIKNFVHENQSKLIEAMKMTDKKSP